jgi:hypothetical protein
LVDCVVEEVERLLGVSDDADRLRAADVLARLVAEGTEAVGDPVDGGVEPDRVGRLGADVDVLDAVVVGLADPDALALGGDACVVLRLGRVGGDDGRLDVAAKPAPRESVCPSRDSSVDDLDRLAAQVASQLGDLAGDPGGDLVRANPLPQKRKPMAQVEGVGDQCGRGVSRDLENGPELGRRELGNLRSTVAAEADELLGAGDGGLRDPVELAVEVGPVCSESQDIDLGPPGRRLGLVDRRQRLIGAEIAESLALSGGGFRRIRHERSISGISG